MAVFFFLVGLELKREVLSGQLSSPSKSALPALAAIAGIAVPALIYTAVIFQTGQGSSKRVKLGFCFCKFRAR